MPTPRAPLALIVAAGALSLGLIACSGSSDKKTATSAIREPEIYTSSVPRETIEQAQRTTTMVDATTRAGNYLPGETTGSDVKRIRVRYGPFSIGPGQNPNIYDPNVKAPDLPPGFITRFQPNLELEDGTIPPANQVHLHHGVWLVNNEPRWFADAEKSVFAPPDGFGWRVGPDDTWVLNHMLHNLYPGIAKAYLTWDIDFVPEDSATGRKMKEINTLWADVRGNETYPVFDTPFEAGGDGRYVYPDDQPPREARAYPKNYNKISVPADGTLVLAVGHLHPGGLDNTLSLTRAGKTTQIHRGESTYFDPKGPVSWDMAMGVTKPNWRVAVEKGDVLSLTSTYDTKSGAWFESMGLAVIGFAPGDTSGLNPFTQELDTGTRLTHDRLEENLNSGGAATSLPDASTLPDGQEFGIWDGRAVEIDNFVYRPGNIGTKGPAGNPPTIAQGQRLSFVSLDAARNIPHTITACKKPCTGAAGHGFPLVDTAPAFDSGQLGFGVSGITAQENRASWSTPAGLTTGTYTYFCRIHPFMRGAFRVTDTSPDPFTNALLGSAGPG
jgi:plastocyanin